MEKLKDSKKASGASEPSKTPFQSQFGVHFGGPFWTNFQRISGHLLNDFLDLFLDHFWTTLGSIFGVICRFERGPQMDLFWGWFLEAPRSSLVRFLGRHGALLGALVFQNARKKHIETHVCKNALVRHLSSLGTLLEAILACFGPIWDPKMDARSQ
jgi:hypothetical protein